MSVAKASRWNLLSVCAIRSLVRDGGVLLGKDELRLSDRMLGG